MEPRASTDILNQFSSAARLPTPVTPALFNARVKDAVDCIEYALGPEAQLVRYLRTEPPVPMKDSSSWSRTFGNFSASSDPLIKFPTEIRPDLVFYPIYLIAVLAHEGTHAIDPQAVQTALLAQRLKYMQESDPEYASVAISFNKMYNQVEYTAVEAEVSVLSALKPPEPAFLASEQLEYFYQQRRACLASRNLQFQLLEITSMGYEFLQLLGASAFRVERNSQAFLASQDLVDFLVFQADKGDEWLTKTIGMIDNLRDQLRPYKGAAEFDSWFERFAKILHHCQCVHEEVKADAQKLIVPVLRGL